VKHDIIAHIGMGTYRLLRGDRALAMEFGARGLALADRAGYVAWAIHRPIPVLGESGLHVKAYDRVQALTERLHDDSTALD